MRNYFPISRLALMTFLLCASTGVVALQASDASDRQLELNGGYYLLHHLADDESHLPILLDMKHAPAEIVTYADTISKTAKTSLSTLDRLQNSDPSIRFDRNPLPAIERDVRDSIKDDKQHQLLFGTTDAEFVRALLVSQIEACTYADHLSKVLADKETDPVRAKALQHLSAQWLEQRTQAFRLLRNY